MTDKERAAQLVMAVSGLPRNDAIELIAAHLALARAQGEKTGVEQAAQAISQMRAAE